MDSTGHSEADKQPAKKPSPNRTGDLYGRHSRRAVWLQFFLSPTALHNGRSTFLNKTASTKAAGYSCRNENAYQSLGWRIWRDLRPVIEECFQEIGLTEDHLKWRLLELMGAKKTVYFSHQGEVTDQREIPDLQTQIQALKLALQVKGMLKARAHVQLTGENGGPVKHEHGLSDEARALLRELLEQATEE